jgi:hypothetical protein
MLNLLITLSILRGKKRKILNLIESENIWKD